MPLTQQEKIAVLNDLARTTLVGSLRVLVTPGISTLPMATQALIYGKVQEFKEFTSDNDPHKEHDFGSVEVEGNKVFWKIDYYNKAMDGGSEDPADPEQTTRVLTIMLASEY